MSKQIQKIIDDRKKWMAENSIQDWTDDDTIHVAEKCIKKLSLEGLSNEQVEGMREHIKNLSYCLLRVRSIYVENDHDRGSIDQIIIKSQQYIKP